MKKNHPNATDPFSYEEVEELRELDLEEKIRRSKELIKKELSNLKNPVVSFSGGKSSEVALHLTLQIDSDIFVVYNETGVSYPETQKFVKSLSEEWGFNLIITEPKKGFWEVVEEHGLPENRSGSGTPRCCFWLKERPMREIVKEREFDSIITGEQAFESQNRRLVLMQYGEAFDYRKWKDYLGRTVRKIKPLSIWKDYDVWNYIFEKNLDVNPAYSKYEIERTGCVTCTAFNGWEEKMKRYSQELYEHIKSIEESESNE